MESQDNLSWQAILKPGCSDDFFEASDRTPFQVDANYYHPANAWWLSELCRLIYRKNEMVNAQKTDKLTRNDILKEVHLEEVHFLSYPFAQGALVKTLSGAKKPFAVLVFRGTKSNVDTWLANLQFGQTAWHKGGLVHSGYKRIFDNFWPELRGLLRSLDCPVYYTGHSLGAALATLTASMSPPKALYTFGSPRIGNIAFAKTLQHVNAYRIVNTYDIVSAIPPTIGPLTFCHVGTVQYLYRHKTSGKERRSLLSLSRLLIRLIYWRYAPRFLAEHAPVNYTTRLKTRLNPLVNQ
jgi:hypothetical protein